MKASLTFIDVSHIKTNTNTIRQVKIQISAVSRHHARKLMEEVSAFAMCISNTVIDPIKFHAIMHIAGSKHGPYFGISKFALIWVPQKYRLG